MGNVAQVCPLCMGQGWQINSFSATTDARCKGCDGKGIVWPPIESPEIVELRAEIARLRVQLDSMGGYKEKVDRKVYMREYMRKRRAAPQLS